MNRFSFLALSMIVVGAGCSSTKSQLVNRPTEWSERVAVIGFDNLYRVDENLYRSEQPSTSEMVALQQFGIKSILNLRRVQDDKREARKTRLVLNHIPVNTFKMSHKEILKSLRIIEGSDKPILVHCLHGSDRTGVVVAAYRIVKQGWTKEAAIKEFQQGGYGYHEKWFPNLTQLLETLDVDKLKSDLQTD